MTGNKKKFLSIIVVLVSSSFFLSSCSHIPFIGKKNEEKPADKLPEGRTVTIEGMGNIKGVNPPKQDSPSPSRRPSNLPPQLNPPSRTASIPASPSYRPSLPFFQLGFKKKVVILDFENKTTYKDEKIGDAAANRLSDKLEATQRVVVVDRTVVSEMLNKQGFKYDSLADLSAMKRTHESLGIQAFAWGTVTDVSLLSSKASETSDEEVSFATAKVEVRLIDASTGNLLKTLIGRSPIFGTKETGEYNRSKAVLKAIEFGFDEILEGFLRQIDLLDWTTTIAKVEGENLYINAGKLSGLQVGDTLEVYEPGKEIIHPATNLSLGWTTGQLKGAIRVTDLFGVDASAGKAVQGQGFSTNDVVKSTIK